MSNKLNVLFLTEFSQSSSGYSKLAREVMGRLYDSNKYNLFELAGYCNPTDERIELAPWKIYPTMPHPNSGPEVMAEFNSHPDNARGGRWKFNDCLLDCEPDIVFCSKDAWYEEFAHYFPFRNLYNLVWWNPVDGYPLEPEWVAAAVEADSCFTYTDWGYNILKEACGNKGNIIGSMPLGVNPKDFYPIYNKAGIKEYFEFKPDTLITGFVARNQPRKLIAALIESFTKFLNNTTEDIKSKCFLYLHTSWPDMSWNIPQLLKDYGVGNRVLFTYQCNKCKAVYPTIYSDIGAVCKKCGCSTAATARSSEGVNEEQMNHLYNFIDVYVQLSTCLAAGTQVKLRNGWTPIENVKVGDEAFTHNGSYQKVLKTFVNETDEIYNISIHSDFESIKITGNHPVYAISSKMTNYKCPLREYLGCLLHDKKPLPQADFINIEDLKSGDMIGYRINDTIVDIDKLDISYWCYENEVITDNEVSISSGHIYNRFIDIDENFCKFIGLFAADGTSSLANGISISCHENEIYNRDFSEEIMNSFSKIPKAKVSKYKNRAAYKIDYHSSIHKKLFISLCSIKSTKRLPDWYELLPKNKQLAMLQGLLLGDGCYFEARNVTSYNTISPTLAEQIKHLLRRLRIDFNCSLRPRKGRRQDQYNFEITGNIVNNGLANKRTNTRNLYIDNYHFLQIKEMKKEIYNKPVYNFEVENDNSYLTKIGIVHNCEGFGIPAAEAIACAVPTLVTDYSGTCEIIKYADAIPIPSIKLIREMESGANRYLSLPNTDILANQLHEIYSLPTDLRRSIGYKQYLKGKNRFSWDITAKILMNHFDTLPKRNWRQGPVKIHKPNMNIPDNLSPEQMVHFLHSEIIGRPELFYRFNALKQTYELIMQTQLNKPHFRHYTLDDAIRDALADNAFYNEWELKRANKFGIKI